MHKQQQLCAAYKRQNSFFSSNAACVACCETSKNPLLSDPLELKSASMGPKCNLPKVVAISPIWARQPQLFSMRLIPGKDKGVRKSALSSIRPSWNFLEKQQQNVFIGGTQLYVVHDMKLLCFRAIKGALGINLLTLVFLFSFRRCPNRNTDGA